MYYEIVYDMFVNVIYYVHVCEQAHWARSVGNSAIENLCIIIITLLYLYVDFLYIYIFFWSLCVLKEFLSLTLKLVLVFQIYTCAIFSSEDEEETWKAKARTIAVQCVSWMWMVDLLWIIAWVLLCYQFIAQSFGVQILMWQHVSDANYFAVSKD